MKKWINSCNPIGRKKLEEKGICLLLLLALPVCMTGCEKKEVAGEDVMRVGVVTYTQDDPNINVLTDTLKENFDKEKDEDTKIIVSVKSGDDDQEIQNEVVEEMIDAGCDILCVNLVDRTEPSKIIRLAKENDIPILFFNREPVEEDIFQWNKLYYIGCDARQSGEIQGQIAADYIKSHPEADKNQDGKIQYLILVGEAGHQDAISRTEISAKTVMEEGVNLEKLSYQFADWSRSQAENRVSRLISQYGDGIELILANNDEMALGAIQAYQKAGYEGEDCPLIFGIDGLKDALEAIKNGSMQGTVYQDKDDMARQMTDMALALYRGESLESLKLENTRYYNAQYQRVDQTNVEEYLQK